MARWGRPLLRCTVSNVCAEGELTVGVFKTSDQIQKGPSAEQTHHQKILYISSYINTDAYCPCQVAWHAKHPFWRVEPCTTPRTQLFRLKFQVFSGYLPSCTTSNWCSWEKKTSRHHFYWSCTTLPFPLLPSWSCIVIVKHFVSIIILCKLGIYS